MNLDIRKYFWSGLKILLLCLVVGYGLSLLDLNALDVWRWMSNQVRYVFENAEELLGRAGPYIVSGAAIVVPIVLLKFGLDLLKRNRRSGGS